MSWKALPERVTAPYLKAEATLPAPEYRGARGTPWESGIVHQYREGKVKRTSVRGVKQNLKPDAYKLREPGLPGDRVPFA